ncbi:MAG: signal recognition particle receptor subunit alpha, partial [Rickettsiales bacterium]|nr:signal recognition particle receptor subunit alpha [Rickettsiales bacterium]
MLSFFKKKPKKEPQLSEDQPPLQPSLENAPDQLTDIDESQTDHVALDHNESENAIQDADTSQAVAQEMDATKITAEDQAEDESDTSAFSEQSTPSTLETLQEDTTSSSVLVNAASDTDASDNTDEKPESKSWFQRLKSGLSKSSSKLSDGITGIFTKAKLDEDTLEELEDLLLTTDIGVKTTTEIITTISQKKMEKDISPAEVKEIISEKITTILEPVAKPLTINPALSPHIIMVCGVNGNGKTTTIGKLAKQYRESGKKVMLVACDTFRAAAVEQLKVWSERASTEFISGDANADPASVAYKAIEQAKNTGIDVVMIDTAGRLHNKLNLMQELEKITRVIRKHDEDAPHD